MFFSLKGHVYKFRCNNLGNGLTWCRHIDSASKIIIGKVIFGLKQKYSKTEIKLLFYYIIKKFY